MGDILIAWIPGVWIDASRWIVAVAIAAGVGGYVHGIMRPTPARYTVAWPFSQRTTELGFLGDILVGITAGVAIFIVIDSVFNLKLDDQSQPITFLKVVALGVICGYFGGRSPQETLIDSLQACYAGRGGN